jgi:hypothetical protein
MAYTVIVWRPSGGKPILLTQYGQRMELLVQDIKNIAGI